MWPAVVIGAAIAYALFKSRSDGTVLVKQDPIDGFVHPIPGACVSSGFKSANRPTHLGIDYGVPVGTAVYAPHDGQVYANWEVPGGCGLLLGIGWDGGNGAKGPHIEMCHLSEILVSEGQTVSAGELVAYSGATGGVSPHLHIEYKDAITQTYVFPPWEAANPSPLCPNATMADANNSDSSVSNTPS
jgi:murein DD-endopeptidase MepM/ murein hydrolase activator NlpD